MRTLLLLLTLVASTALSAQVGLPLTQQAAQECNAGQLDVALKTMEVAMASGEDSHPFAWYVLGFIHKEFYVKRDNSSMRSPHRAQAEEAILHSMDLDPAGEYADNNRNALRFLAISHYNDALQLTKTFMGANAELPEGEWERFQSLMVYVEPDYDFDANAADFFKHMGRGYNRIYLESGGEDRLLLDYSSRYYKRALDYDGDDYKANYNLAINYYNLGVKRIKQIDHNTDIFELLRIQDECVVLFQLALPYMAKAHAEDPERVETLKGMMAIHRALSNRTISDQFRTQLRDILGEE